MAIDPIKEPFNQVAGPSGAYPVGAAPEVIPGSCEDEDGLIPGDDLLEAAAMPQSVTVDGQQVVERSLADLIALQKQLKAQKGLCYHNGNGWGAVAKSKVVPPSATGDV
jgi:hypothetical protein